MRIGSGIEFINVWLVVEWRPDFDCLAHASLSVVLALSASV